MGADRLFTADEFQKRYDEVELSQLTNKVSLVPHQFFDPGKAAESLSAVVDLAPGDKVEWLEVPQYGAVLIYSNDGPCGVLSEAVARTIVRSDGGPSFVAPEMYRILQALPQCGEYNKLVCSWASPYLHLAMAQGDSLKLCNCYKAPDFTTAQYFIFLTMKEMQLNPEMTVLCVRTALELEQEMSLYRYFKAVEKL